METTDMMHSPGGSQTMMDPHRFSIAQTQALGQVNGENISREEEESSTRSRRVLGLEEEEEGESKDAHSHEQRLSPIPPSKSSISASSLQIQPHENDSTSRSPSGSNTLHKEGPEVTAVEEKEEKEGGGINNVEPPYTIFTNRQRGILCFFIGVAGFLSPTGSSIYSPAIPALARSFGVSTQSINLTVTVYLIAQGITPSLWGSISDSMGRRPLFLMCLTTFSVANIILALIPSSAYWALMVFRIMSAGGSAVTISLGAGVISDIAAPSERGKFMAYGFLGAQCGPALGPVLGGILTQFLGWRSIFWFLFITCMVVFVVLLFFLSETLRSMVGNGSIPPEKWYSKSLWDLIKENKRKVIDKRSGEEEGEEVVGEKELREKELVRVGMEKARKRQQENKERGIGGAILDAMKLFLEKDALILLLSSGFHFSIFYSLNVALGSLLQEGYHLNELELGLCYLPLGVGAIIANFASGRHQDWLFQRMKKKIAQRNAEELEKDPSQEVGSGKEKNEVTDFSDFPIEHVRLSPMPFWLALYWSSSVGMGFLIQYTEPLAATLVVSFFVGLGFSGAVQGLQILLLDLFRGKGATITANNNLTRCFGGAIGTGIINPMLDAINAGPTVAIFVGMAVLWAPMQIYHWKMGPQWRAERAERERKQLEAKEAREAQLSDVREDSPEEKVSIEDEPKP